MTVTKDWVLLAGTGSGTRRFDLLNTFDDLGRLAKAQEGQLNFTTESGGSPSEARHENYARNLAGKPVNDQVDLNANSVYTDGPLPSVSGGEMDDSRTFNARNELRARSLLDKDNPGTAATYANDHTPSGSPSVCGLLERGVPNVRLADVYSPQGRVQPATQRFGCRTSSTAQEQAHW